MKELEKRLINGGFAVKDLEESFVEHVKKVILAVPEVSDLLDEHIFLIRFRFSHTVHLLSVHFIKHSQNALTKEERDSIKNGLICSGELSKMRRCLFCNERTKKYLAEQKIGHMYVEIYSSSIEKSTQIGIQFM